MHISLPSAGIAMAQKFLLRPRYFINNLWKEGTRMISLAHENTLVAQLKLINAMDTLHRSEHGDFNIDIIQFTGTRCQIADIEFQITQSGIYKHPRSFGCIKR